MTNQALLLTLDARLRGYGFRRKGSTWNRVRGELTDVIEVQKHSAWAWVTVNYGVYSQEVVATVWPDAPPQSHKQQPSCVVRRRIRDRDSREEWFELDSSHLVEAIETSIVAQALSCFDKVAGPDAMREAVADNMPRTAQDEAFKAVLLNASGRHEESCSVLRSAIAAARSATWRTVLGDLASRLNCT